MYNVQCLFAFRQHNHTAKAVRDNREAKRALYPAAIAAYNNFGDVKALLLKNLLRTNRVTGDGDRAVSGAVRISTFCPARNSARYRANAAFRCLELRVAMNVAVFMSLHSWKKP